MAGPALEFPTRPEFCVAEFCLKARTLVVARIFRLLDGIQRIVVIEEKLPKPCTVGIGRVCLHRIRRSGGCEQYAWACSTGIAALLSCQGERRWGASMRFVRLAGIAIGAAALSACGEQNRYVAPPPPRVTVAPPLQRPFTRYLEVTGTTAAVNFANLVARVPGFVDEINYQDGALVKAGTLLFTIEPVPYEVKLKQAQASVVGARATLVQAQKDFERYATLIAQQSTSRQLYDQAITTRDTAQSNLSVAEANVVLAQLNSDYAHVKAPFDGVVTARQVSIGEFVGGTTTPTQLATIVQLDPIYVNFNISEQDVQRLRTEMQQRGMQREDLKKVPIEVGLQTESGYPHVGTLDYAAPTLNVTTGTLSARGVFANANRALLPGYFVRGRIPIGHEENTLLVPDVALGADQSGRYVLLVGKDGTVEQRHVTVGPLEDGLRAIDSGLAADDRVVIAGVQYAIPGQKVDAQAASPGRATAPSASTR
jgi:RND family efflux transporter MFP subunit